MAKRKQVRTVLPEANEGGMEGAHTMCATGMPNPVGPGKGTLTNLNFSLTPPPFAKQTPFCKIPIITI